MTDEDGIRKLLARYSHVHDKKDADGFAALFTEDGLFSTATSKSDPVGRRALREFIAASYARKGTMRTKHLYGIPDIDVHGDRADVTTDFVIFKCVDGGVWEIKMVGQSVDKVVRQNGQWLFAERRNIDNNWDGAQLESRLQLSHERVKAQ